MADDAAELTASATQIDRSPWRAAPVGYRRRERSVVLGHGPAVWDSAAMALMRWGVKTRSGFTVQPEGSAHEDGVARAGADYLVTFALGPLRVREPVRVVATIGTSHRVGFAYVTRPGHPVRGEEAFLLINDDGRVCLTIRSLTRRADNPWALLHPILLVVQRVMQRRYLRALTPGARHGR